MKLNPSKSIVSGARILITGGARGMGALYARQAAARGASTIVLWDVDEPAAQKLSDELTSPSTRVEICTSDLSDFQEVQQGAAQIRDLIGHPDILINNAGIVRGAPFWEHDPQRDISAIMTVNALSPMWITREFLPDMIARKAREKRVLNIASAAGTLANPNMSVYAASKWALIGWSDSVRLELAQHGHSHVKITTFCPSYVSTGMFAGARGPLLTPILSPQEAARAAWNGMIVGQPLVTKPWTVKFAMAVRGVLPTAAWDVTADKLFKVYSSMDNFSGHSGT
ncbi:SDR family NAD(P)-dependent oxidoreductase [Timonella sp. A28]|uniref:SDR family NAD(P)-dependent oxidoreductase n=1 Tax=Timonella sp. A28 TaxID=3442640 RepID=UPI003EBF8B9E